MSIANDLIREAKRLNLTLIVEDDGLYVQGKKLPPAFIEKLRAHKPELLACLTASERQQQDEAARATAYLWDHTVRQYHDPCLPDLPQDWLDDIGQRLLLGRSGLQYVIDDFRQAIRRTRSPLP